MAKQVLLLFTTCLFSARSYDIHKYMNMDELRRTFHVDHHSLVPEYEIVHIHHINRRSIEDSRINSIFEHDVKSANSFPNFSDKTSTKVKNKNGNVKVLKFSAFGKPINLTLTKSEGLLKKGGLKLWMVEPNATAQHGVEYIEIQPEEHENIGDTYQDEENEAAVLLHEDEHVDSLTVEGSIGPNLVIKPFPKRLTGIANAADQAEKSKTGKKTILNPTTNDDEMFLDADGELSSEVSIDTGLPIKRKENTSATTLHRHIIYKKDKDEEEDTFSDYAFMEPDHISKRYRRSALNSSRTNSRKKREAPYTIYPEILVIVDYDGYRLHGGDNLQIKRYFVSFWNGVDLRYKLLKGPKIRISIAGIIISRGRDATPYLERNRVGRDAIDSAAALTDMGKYLFKERRLPVYDIAVAITKYDMCRRRKGGRCTKGTAGFAYVGGACVVNKRLEKVNSVAIIEDTGGFSGIIVAAHEVGHLLGAVHDGSPPPSYLGGPGAEKCQWTDGYIMSDLRHTERGFRWSPCSVSSFHHFLNGDTATCLYNAPHEDDSLPRVLPGKLLTLDAQCRRDRGTSACFKDDRVCAQLFCFDAGSGYCVAYRPAAEGSACGDGQYCLNGRCVAEHENIIPDYSQNTPSYVRRDGSAAIPNRSLFPVNQGDKYNAIDNKSANPYTYQQFSTNTNNTYRQQTTKNPLIQNSGFGYFQNQFESTATTTKLPPVQNLGFGFLQNKFSTSTTIRSTTTTTTTSTTTKPTTTKITTTKYPPIGFRFFQNSFTTKQAPNVVSGFGLSQSNYISSTKHSTTKNPTIKYLTTKYPTTIYTTTKYPTYKYTTTKYTTLPPVQSSTSGFFNNKFASTKSPSAHTYGFTTTKSPSRQTYGFRFFQSVASTVSTAKVTTTTTTKPTSAQTQKPYTYAPPFTTKSPYSINFKPFSSFSTTTPQPTTKAPFFSFKNQVTASTLPPITTRSTTVRPYTTKSPFFFTSLKPFFTQSQTTKNPYIGDYYQKKQRTTINPYDFRNFGKPAVNNDDSYHNNYLKRSYNSASFYSDSSNKQNQTTFRFNG